ncbi:DUF5977 domain-containing protein [Pedobacter antarcticus]|uniref:phage head spike fiber domain-containing protein n=1 Tax=Pedobacter antarcticus TaxID=34086 RepID=UPI0029318413|nr:hypothetical protein [Pedobacter antarcticus]
MLNMDLTNYYFINDTDAFRTYGLILTKGAYGELTSLPSAWPDDTRKIGIPVQVHGLNEVDFWAKFNALRAVLSASTDFSFTITDLHRRFKLNYSGVSSFKMLTKSSGGYAICAAFTLNVSDDYPDIFTVTRTGSFQKNNAPDGYAGEIIQYTRTYTSFSQVDAQSLANSDASFNTGGQEFANNAGRNIPAFEFFKSQVVTDGGSTDPLLDTEYAKIHPLATWKSDMILVPGALKAGRIYGVNPRNGNVIPFTFSRTSTGTYIDKNGLMQTAVAGVPRIDHDPVTKECLGYLLEGLTENLIRYSNNFINWANGSQKTISNTATTSYGKSMSTIIKVTDTTSESLYTNTVLSTANSTYSFRITLRADTSDKITIGLGGFADPAGGGPWGLSSESSFRIIYGPGAISPYGSQGGAICDVTGLLANEDTVVELTRRYGTADISVRANLFIDRPTSTTIGAANKVSCAQLENLPGCTSYVETSATSGIRNLDVLRSDSDLCPGEQHTCSANMRLISREAVGTSTMGILRGSVNGRFWYSTGGNKYGVLAYDGVNSVTPIPQPTTYQFNKVCTSYGTEGLRGSINGGPVATRIYTAPFGIPGALIISSQNISATHIKNISLFPLQLTGEEHIQITTS